jgi:hypothetical protein
MPIERITVLSSNISKALTVVFLALALCFASLWGLDARPWSTGWSSPSLIELIETTYSGYACLLCAGLSIATFAFYNHAERNH